MTVCAAPTILLVEDDPRTACEIASAITHGLPAPGARAVVQPTVALAWAWLAQHPPPALIVIDQFLGGESGLTLAARLQADPRLAAVPRIAYSQAPMAAADRFAICLRKGPGHAGLLAQIARLTQPQR